MRWFWYPAIVIGIIIGVLALTYLIGFVARKVSKKYSVMGEAMKKLIEDGKHN